MRGLVRDNGFVLTLLGVLVFALIFPELGAPDGPLIPGTLTKIGVMIIFLTQGLSLQTEQLLRGLLQVRIHLFIQSWNFLFTPLLMLLLLALAGQSIPYELRVGFLYLSFLPTTVSSAIALSASAGGNVPAAIFNTSLSNVLAVFLVPLWVLATLGLGAGSSAADTLDLLQRLALMILLPLGVGQALRPFIKPLILRIQPLFKPLNNGIILFMIFAAVSSTVLESESAAIGANLFLLLFSGAALYLFLTSALVWFSSKRLFPVQADRITAFYCASQKSLATGVPMGATIFAIQPDLAPAIGLILMPLIIYHPAELFLGSIVLRKIAVEKSLN